MKVRDVHPDFPAQERLPVGRADRNRIHPGCKPEMLSLYFLLFLFFKGFHRASSPVWMGCTAESDCLPKTLAEH